MEKEQEQTAKTKTSEEAKTIGEYLRYTRLAQKKTLEGVAKALCIRKIYIKAIEENNFKELPAIPYGTGFVRSYAAYLGLNVDRIVQCYKEEALPKKTGSKQIVKSHDRESLPNKYQILIGLLGLLLLYAAWFVYSQYRLQESEPLPVVAAEQVAPVSEQVLPEASVDMQNEMEEILPVDEISDQQLDEISDQQSEAQPESAGLVVEQEEPLKNEMIIKFNGESWMEIRDDQKVYITGIYDKGFEYKVPDKAGLIFSVGKEHNVDVYLNGELIKITRPQKQTRISLDKYLNH